MNTALEYSTRVVQEGGRRCKKSTLNDLVHLTPLRIPLANPPYLSRLPKYWPPHPPQRPASVYPPSPFGAGRGHTHCVERGVWRGSIFWKTRDTALYSTYVSSLWSQVSGQIFKRRRERFFLHLGYLLHGQLSYKPYAFLYISTTDKKFMHKQILKGKTKFLQPSRVLPSHIL